MTALPKAVQRQLEQADAIQTQLSAAPAVEVVEDASQIAAPPPPPATAPEPPAPPKPPVDTTDWKNKALTLEGMLRSQVPDLRAQNTVLQSQVAQLTQTVEALRTSPRTAEPAKPTADPKDVEQFGADMMDMVQRYVTGAVADMKRSVEARFQALEGSVQTVGKKADDSREAQFWVALEAAVPNYRDINASEGWQGWLSQVDELTGFPRQAALQAAQSALDSARVAKIFKLYEQSLPPRVKPESLAAQVVPTTGGASAVPTASPAPQVFREKFVQDFYREVQKGKYRGREAEAERIEAAIYQAASEGRIVR